MTHEFMAMMLGVRRAGVTVIAGSLKQAGLISYTNGSMTILDRPSLESASCECYGIVQRHLKQLLG
ncbi:helix-turn-helix domain-containing protein (plasmid) [Skermanella mucosa]|uniref:helix-turn-helix domain-containing protein n=1 Tax=Skermanella mucosa TaxID=1789672 RepID=UPI001E5766D7|nr:helix-turn-helix domain-containing protein [Skermanella mucosa]UEM25148.1 helix-turn-helix domain-containing protein [Skermanella mucosa]